MNQAFVEDVFTKWIRSADASAQGVFMMFTRYIHTLHFCSSQDANVELIQSKVLKIFDCEKVHTWSFIT